MLIRRFVNDHGLIEGLRLGGFLFGSASGVGFGRIRLVHVGIVHVRVAGVGAVPGLHVFGLAVLLFNDLRVNHVCVRGPDFRGERGINRLRLGRLIRVVGGRPGGDDRRGVSRLHVISRVGGLGFGR